MTTHQFALFKSPISKNMYEFDSFSHFLFCCIAGAKLKRNFSFFRQVCAGYLRAYFECKVGPVSNAYVVKLEDSRKTRAGYVTFVMPEDAAV